MKWFIYIPMNEQNAGGQNASQISIGGQNAGVAPDFTPHIKCMGV